MIGVPTKGCEVFCTFHDTQNRLGGDKCFVNIRWYHQMAHQIREPTLMPLKTLDDARGIIVTLSLEYTGENIANMPLKAVCNTQRSAGISLLTSAQGESSEHEGLALDATCM
jgi:hypothetical protein